MPRPSRAEFGKWAEDHACRTLERHGYAIRERRHRTRFGEIDIIATDRGVLVFVEVKARRSATCGSPAEAVTAAKRRRLLQLAERYLQRHQLTNTPCRFDVVSVYCPGPGEPPRVEHVQSAFDSSS
jgi:putative endonuclease